MGRLVGIVVTVLAIYFAANYVTGTKNGTASDGPEAVELRSTPQRAGDSVREAFSEGAERRQRLLPE